MASDPKVRERRRGERVLIRMPIKVYGIGKDGKHVNEDAEAIVVSRGGALLRATTPLKAGSSLEVRHGLSQQTERFRVVWVSERSKEGKYDVGIELQEPRDEFWGIRFPPVDRNA
jgi:hypothetical protein